MGYGKPAKNQVGPEWWIRWSIEGKGISHIILFRQDTRVTTYCGGWYNSHSLTKGTSHKTVFLLTYIMKQGRKELDDGWPESVEEQGLLLLVWRHNFRNNIWKMCYRQSRRGVSRQNSEKCKTIVCIANTFTHRSFYTQKLSYTEAFTDRRFHTQRLSHTKAFTDRHFHTQKLLHTEAFTHRRFYTDTFTHRHVYTQTLLHTDPFTHRSCFYTQTLVHTEAFTHRRFYTQALLHTNTFTHKHFYTQTLYTQTVLHTDGFTHKRFYTQSLVHTDAFTQRPSHVLTAKPSLFWPPQQSDGVVWRSPISMWLETSIYKHVMRAMCFGAPQPRWFAIPWKKNKRADLAGGERFWAGTHTVLQYDISWFFLGLGSWFLTVTGIETLMLTLIHPSLYINTHTSFSISYCYSYLNIKYIDLSLCGSSLPIHVIHPISGPWLHANLAAQTNFGIAGKLGGYNVGYNSVSFFYNIGYNQLTFT